MDNVKCHSQLALGLNGNTLSFCSREKCLFWKRLKYKLWYWRRKWFMVVEEQRIISVISKVWNSGLGYVMTLKTEHSVAFFTLLLAVKFPTIPIITVIIFVIVIIFKRLFAWACRSLLISIIRSCLYLWALLSARVELIIVEAIKPDLKEKILGSVKYARGA